ncbi:MAG TPA: hypothetical protein VJ779_02335 [Acetobacteraceae bacterium]|nr:hypothetical protein [Acetobacteraceae bacterium]
MHIHPYGCEIELILANNRVNSSKAELIFERYTALPSKMEREAFVLALIAELLVNRARLTGDCIQS